MFEWIRNGSKVVLLITCCNRNLHEYDRFPWFLEHLDQLGGGDQSGRKVEGLAERKPEAELVKSNSIESGTLLVKDGLEVATDLDGEMTTKTLPGALNMAPCQRLYRPLSYTEPRRTSILTSSRHWRAAPNLKSGGYFRTDWKTKPPFRNGRTSYSCQRSQKIFPFKKRKFFDQCTLPTSDGAFHTEKAFLIIWIFLI
ncbi:hypothetical protein OIU78_003246 [Salix suchowensis]|nr:hypothetical protein OIU78_003246 [Salix suchowensis]